MCLLIPILTGLISALLGYLLGKLSGGGNNNVDVDVWKNKVARLEADLKVCKSGKLQLENDLSSAKESLVSSGNSRGSTNKTSSSSSKAGARGGNATSSNMASSFAGATASTIAFDAAVAKATFGKKIKENDLTVVEGIGPKIKELFHNFDIKTWASLATTSVEKCKEVLESGGSRFKMHKPQTWPEQAGLAAEGEWQKLKDLQDALDGGR